VDQDPLRHVREHEQLHPPFGGDRFGRAAEKFARFFGTPRFILGQTVVVALWIVVNGLAVAYRWDPYPLILLNLVLSTQAAYAAPLILLAQTRQADRDKTHEEAAAKHREEIASTQYALLAQNTELTQQIANLTEHLDKLTSAIHQRVVEMA
jgi:uncharacterized membrane protein